MNALFALQAGLLRMGKRKAHGQENADRGYDFSAENVTHGISNFLPNPVSIKNREPCS